MTLRLISGFAMAAVAVVGFAVPSAMAKSAGGASAVRMMDTDSDGTVDMKEVQTMASATFDRLEKDSDTTLDSKELKGRLSKSGVKAADPDADGTLDKNEYLAAVSERFKMADPDGDGTLDAKELNSKAGKALIALIK